MQVIALTATRAANDKRNMETQSKAAQILRSKFEEIRQRNRRWSQRAFAKKIGISSGALSEIMLGKRTLSPQIKKKLALKLQLSPREQIEFFEDELPPHLKQKRIEYVQLSTDQFHLISDWWHYAILNLTKTKGFRPLPSWISERLGIPIKIAHEAWERLFRLGHLEREAIAEGKSKIVRKYPQLESSDNLFDLSVQKSHLEDLALIERSLLEIPVESRDNTSMTLVMNKSELAHAKELIRIFQDRFSEQIEQQVGEEVYRLSISLFPLTEMTKPNSK